MTSPLSSTPRIARYYRGARTVHIERLNTFASGDFFYFKPMYDFDEKLAGSTPGVRRVRFGHVFMAVLRRRYDVLEMAEPFTPSALPQNLALALASRLSGFGGKAPTRFVTYAIENADLSKKIAVRTSLSERLVKPIVAGLVYYCYARFSRIVFGTQAAEDNYRELLGKRRFDHPNVARTLIWGLPTARVHDDSPRQPRLVFLGAFDDRKGVVQLMRVWDQVRQALPTASLTLLGKGDRAEEVAAWADERSEVTVYLDPSRALITDQLEAGKALFLLSQPSSLWKEQIGLPIVEGLEMGLEIVASSETGIAGWLGSHGHSVLAADADGRTTAAAIVSAITSTRKPRDITGDLPAVDGRLAADNWLHANGAR